MLRVGNDIVDLMQPLAIRKTRDTRFLKRVFLPDEASYVLTDMQPDAMLWAFWSGKEAAYKAIQKDSTAIPSVPRLYKVSITADTGTKDRSSSRNERLLQGTVETPAGEVRLKTSITSDYVHSVAIPLWAAPDAKIVSQVERMALGRTLSPAYESSLVRNAAKRHLSDCLRCRQKDIEIRRQRGPKGLGPPYVYLQNELAATDISLSHDGDFAAFAFAIFS